MSEDYGKQINMALRAVERMHSDCSRLLRDFDRKMEGWKSVFGSYATRDLTYNVAAERWMAEGVYRFYSQKALPHVVRGVTISFIEAKTEQPLVLVAELKYVDETSEIKAVCREWDIWQLYFDWGSRKALDEVVALTSPDPSKRIQSGRVLAKPLYAINSIEEVAEMMNRVASADRPNSLGAAH